MRSKRIKKSDIFTPNHPIYYRIPNIAVLDQSILAFANRRIKTYADSAEESHVVFKHIPKSDNGPGNVSGLFEEEGWNCPIGTTIVDHFNKRIHLSYCRWLPEKNSRVIATLEEGHFIATTINFGKDWHHVQEIVSPNSFNCRAHSHGASQAITIRHGPKNGRLVVPARFFTKPGEDLQNLQDHHYNCALFSDDNGNTWQTSEPVQAGTGEGCLVELSDGRIYYNSRAYFLDGKRRIAWSYDAGETFEDFSVDKALCESVHGGCNAGMALYTPRLSDGKDIILFSNPAGEKREQMTVRASFDGGRSWPVAKVIHAGPAAYSSMAAGEDGSIYLLFENGENHPYEKISLAVFGLDWLSAP